MNQQLIDGFETDLGIVKQRIAAARAELDGVPDDDEEAAAIARFKITAIEQYFSWLEDVLGKCFRAEAQLEVKLTGFVKWRASVLAARAALAELEPFERLIPAAQAEVDQAEIAFSNAQAALGNHLSHPIANPDFAARSTLKKWEEGKAALEARLQDRVAKLRSVKERLGELQTEAARKKHEVFDRPGGLLFQSEMLAPREPQKPQGFGRLDAVN
jgi:hypothetical protein